MRSRTLPGIAKANKNLGRAELEAGGGIASKGKKREPAQLVCSQIHVVHDSFLYFGNADVDVLLLHLGA